ncbi:hypothetical protein [Streptomyces cyaneofuscatus]|uniref:hypothetical protein n=1 Tax=Streptomyces cyaneofuscatus TaxID=66883 RepID=UPI0037B57665
MNDGATWTAGAPLPHLKPADRGWISTGPGHGIQLSRGPHRGRLVVPGDYTATGDRAGGRLFYSDDGGLTWVLGAQADVDKNTAPACPAELTVAETTGGGPERTAPAPHLGHRPGPVRQPRAGPRRGPARHP